MTAAQAAKLVAGANRFDVELDSEAMGRLGRFLDVFDLWNRRIRLTGERDLDAVIERHVIDSMALAPELPGAGLVIDIGSGGGFPGIVLACLRPDLTFALVESRRRRISFLREAIRSIPLANTRALEMRAEAAAIDAALSHAGAVVTARAIRLDVFLGLVRPLLAPGGRAIAMQTPRTAGVGPTVAASHGFSLASQREYLLPEGARRSLMVFTRHEEPVP
jgi:16S rRNA (guanine527-N7)-methyltransferase